MVGWFELLLFVLPSLLLLPTCTQGVTQRRWLAFCNPPLRDLVTAKLGSDGWIRDLYQLSALRAHADDEAFQAQWQEVKLTAKKKAAALIERLTGTW
jgi:starch phosphorylase